MDIVIHAMGMPFDGNTIKEKSLGGSETAAYYHGLELAKLGHRVTMFTTCKEVSETDGVRYIPLGNVTQQTPLGDAFDMYATHTPIDVLIIQRHPLAFHKRYNSRINVWQLHDLALYRTTGAVQAMAHNITFVTVVSQWHKDQVCKVYGLNPERVHVVRNGVDASLYLNEYAPTDREPCGVTAGKALREQGKFSMLYQSRPERGLEHLVRPGGIMDRLRDTRAHLLVCGYENTTEQMAPYYDQLYRWADELPNVTRLGALTKPQLATLQKSCDLLCYPTEFEEVSCITAMEAMHAGLPMLTSECAALPETCEFSGTQLLALKKGKADEDAFVDWIQSAINDAPHPISNITCVLDKMRNLQEISAEHYTWTSAVKQLDKCLRQAAESFINPANLIRNAIEYSDIDAADEVLTQTKKPDAITDAARKEVAELFDFRKSMEKYRAHYAKHQATYYAGPGSKAVGEDVSGTTRFQGTIQTIASYIYQRPGHRLRVLDYGCAHGHYLIPMAKMFPHCDFVGMDISQHAVEAANRWIAQEGLTNAVVSVFDNEKLDPAAWDKFDVVLAGEVVEHVPDDIGLLNLLASMLVVDGLLSVTTPVGRWEWSGMGHNTEFLRGREHLHHYTREDILEMCQEHGRANVLYAPAGPDHAGGAMGSWVWSVQTRNGAKFRKKAVRHLIPRQTLSACLIVKDGEKTLRKCVESFIHAVDEVVIAVDDKTTDRTRAIIDLLKIDYPYKPITVINGVSAVDEGFDAARNKTLERACGDWILWCDADEEVQNPWNLWAFLRPSMIDAVGFPQVHYSADPERVLTTDYPCRLFRNNIGVKFYGVVHEHPEQKVGEGIHYSALRGDVKFLHNGYVNEAVRRERFRRNYPLLLKDREKYPDRKLNRFLMLRDIAQGLMFELEQTGGAVFSGQPERAQVGVDIWREMLDKDPTKMVVDALQYYSACVNLLNKGFDAKFTYNCAKPEAPDLKVNMEVGGRFLTRQDFQRLIDKLHQEATAKYEEPYL